MENVRGGKPIVAVLMPTPVTAGAPNRLLRPKRSSGPSAVDHVREGLGCPLREEGLSMLKGKKIGILLESDYNGLRLNGLS